MKIVNSNFSNLDIRINTKEMKYLISKSKAIMLRFPTYAT